MVETAAEVGRGQGVDVAGPQPFGRAHEVAAGGVAEEGDAGHAIEPVPAGLAGEHLQQIHQGRLALPAHDDVDVR